MAKAIFAGSFDPPTYGHLNIIERARNIFDEIDVVIAFNRSKKSMFSPEERLSMLAQLTAQYKNVSVHLWDKLIVDYAKKPAQACFCGESGIPQISRTNSTCP